MRIQASGGWGGEEDHQQAEVGIEQPKEPGVAGGQCLRGAAAERRPHHQAEIVACDMQEIVGRAPKPRAGLAGRPRAQTEGSRRATKGWNCARSV